MKTPSINQVVGYVAPPAKPGEPTTIKKGLVLETYADHSAKLDLTPRNADFTAAADEEKEPLGHHIAFARFDSHKKRENSWHFLAEEVVQSKIARPAIVPAP
jgi:4-alpha-glucanotransferase